MDKALGGAFVVTDQHTDYLADFVVDLLCEVEKLRSEWFDATGGNLLSVKLNLGMLLDDFKDMIQDCEDKYVSRS